MSINIDKSVKSPYWSAHKYFYSHVIIPTTACQNTRKVIMVIPLKGRGSILKMDHALSPLVFISFPLQPEQLYYGCVQWRVYLCEWDKWNQFWRALLFGLAMIQIPPSMCCNLRKCHCPFCLNFSCGCSVCRLRRGDDKYIRWHGRSTDDLVFHV